MNHTWATLSHGYDEEKTCIYFHCAKDGKKISILQANNYVWGQALVDRRCVQEACDHLYATTQFRGRVAVVEDIGEKEHALKVMIESLDNNPWRTHQKQLLPQLVQKVRIGRIGIEYMSGKKADKIIISK